MSFNQVNNNQNIDANAYRKQIIEKLAVMSDEEKIALGFKEADSIMTLDEFKTFCNELINDISNYREAIECLK